MPGAEQKRTDGRRRAAAPPKDYIGYVLYRYRSVLNSSGTLGTYLSTLEYLSERTRVRSSVYTLTQVCTSHFWDPSGTPLKRVHTHSSILKYRRVHVSTYILECVHACTCKLTAIVLPVLVQLQCQLPCWSVSSV